MATSGNMHEMAALSEAMVSAPLMSSASAQSRLDIIDNCAKGLQNLLLTDWHLDPRLAPLGLKSAWIMATEPTLRALAQGVKHTREAAYRTHTNNIALADFVLSAGLVSHATRLSTGTLSEFTVGALLSWAISTDHLPEGSYYLPTTRQRDASPAHGLRTGYDLLARVPKPRRRYPIQVKNSPEFTGRPYLPGITTVSPEELMPPSGKGDATEAILRSIVGDKSKFLGHAFTRLRAKFDCSEERVKIERQKGNAHFKIAA